MLFPLIGWHHLVVKRPYQVGDRVAIEDSTGDVVAVSVLVTMLWEIDGGLVSSNQPSERIVTPEQPRPLLARDELHPRGVPAVRNELRIQVAYETDLGYATGRMRTIADEYMGGEMAARTERYRQQLSETPVELEMRDRPSVNVVQQESWVEFRRSTRGGASGSATSCTSGFSRRSTRSPTG